jgi:hypothetical protein
MHGLAADPMPTVSSYVGYSLEEPWGQPRVVFGLAAEDAEQLAALLERHDCVGPVYAAVSSLPSVREGVVKAAGRHATLPVPQQAPPVAAQEPPVAAQEPPVGRREEPSAAQKPPVATRQPPAAAQELPVAAQAPPAAAQELPPGTDPGFGGDYDEPLFRQAAAAMQELAATREKPSWCDPAAAPPPADPLVSDPLVSDPLVSDPLVSDPPRTDWPVSEPLTAERPAPEPYYDADPLGDSVEPGSLVRAASAARAEAEARIKALLVESRREASGDWSYPTAEFDTGVGQSPLGGTNGPQIHATDVLEPLPRPEVASGAFSPQTTDPGHLAVGEHETGEPSEPATEDQPASDLPRRSRSARGYPLPRLSRSKRPGTVPNP